MKERTTRTDSITQRLEAAERVTSARDDADAERQLVADQLWMLRQEFRAFAARANDQEIERIIDFAVPNEWLKGHLARYEFALPSLIGRNVLDMACGTGYGSHFLARNGVAQVTGVDIDADAVRYAQLRYRQPRLRFRTADACSRWSDETFDAVVSWETIEHVPTPERMLASVTDMLARDGVFFVSTPIRIGGSVADAPSNPYHVREWSRDEFVALLGQYFEQVDVFAQGFHLPRRLLGVRVPVALRRWVYRRRGHEVRQFMFTDPRVRAFDAVPAAWLEVPPQVLVAACRGPRAPRDAALVQRLVYG